TERDRLLRVLREFFQEVPRVEGPPSAPENGTPRHEPWRPQGGGWGKSVRLTYLRSRAAYPPSSFTPSIAKRSGFGCSPNSPLSTRSQLGPQGGGGSTIPTAPPLNARRGVLVYRGARIRTTLSRPSKWSANLSHAM